MNSKPERPDHPASEIENGSFPYPEAAFLYETRYIAPGDHMSASEASLRASRRAGMSFDVVSQTSGRFGACFLVPFLQNRCSELEIEIATGNVRLFRIEMTGHVTRMQKGYFEFTAEGHLIRTGEEIKSVTVTRKCEGILLIKATLIPQQSRLDWLYLFAWPEVSKEGNLPVSFSASALKYRIESPVCEQDDFGHAGRAGREDVVFDVHALQIFRNYLHIECEISKRDARISRLWLNAPEAIESAQWWTCDLIESSGLKKTVPEGYELIPQRPEYAIPSPRLLESLGDCHAWRGHCITALYKNYGDMRYLNLEQCDARIRKLVLTAEFSDGTLVTLPWPDDLFGEVDFRKDLQKIRRYSLPAEDRVPLFVEVGARGPRSCSVRRLVEGTYQYIGVDLLMGENVDRVGDAHLLSGVVEASTADVVYTHSVLEHLLAPMKFVLEANKILRPGGLFISHAPSCWPLHAEPRDYWRLSSHAWISLLNRMTGFEILEIRESGTASIVPTIAAYSGFSKMQSAPAPLFTSVFARKVSETDCRYTAWSADLATGEYD